MKITGKVYYKNNLIGTFAQTHEKGKTQIFLNENGELIENAKAEVREIVKKYRENGITNQKDFSIKPF